MRKFPLPIDNAECNVFIWRTSAEVKKDSFVVSRLFDDLIRRSFGFVDEVWVKYIELVPLYNLWRRIVRAAQNISEVEQVNYCSLTRSVSDCTCSIRNQCGHDWNTSACAGDIYPPNYNLLDVQCFLQDWKVLPPRRVLSLLRLCRALRKQDRHYLQLLRSGFRQGQDVRLLEQIERRPQCDAVRTKEKGLDKNVHIPMYQRTKVRRSSFSVIISISRSSCDNLVISMRRGLIARS